MHRQPLRASSSLLLLATAALLASSVAGADANSYTDANTDIAFTGIAAAGYRFGMITPENPTTDFIAQIVSPLTNGGGWGGISFGASMVGPMLIATWPNNSKIITAARTAHGYTASTVTPYTAHPITISPIPRGSYINATHISSMFLCRGCINADTFSSALSNDTKSGGDIFFAYAFSQTPVTTPADANTALSTHTNPGGGYDAFRVDLKAARSGEWDKFAALAEGAGGGESTTTTVTSETPTTTTGGPTGTDGGGVASTPEVTSLCEECEMPSGGDYSHRVMGKGGWVALGVVGAVYLVQAFVY